MLIVLSLLTTAGTVVYINKEDVQKQALQTTRDRLAAAEAAAQAARDELTAAQQNLTKVQDAANQTAQAATTDINARQQQISQLQVELAKAQSQQATQQLDVSRLTEALNASQASSTALQTEVARLRQNNDQLVRQASDLNGAVTDLTPRRESVARRGRARRRPFRPPVDQRRDPRRPHDRRPPVRDNLGRHGGRRAARDGVQDPRPPGWQLPRDARGRLGRAERSDRPPR